LCEKNIISRKKDYEENVFFNNHLVVFSITFMYNLKDKKVGIMLNVIGTILLVVSIYLVGNTLSDWLSVFIVIPGNLIGMGILYILLSLKIVTVNFIKTAGDYLLKHMSMFFIPFGVSILLYFDLIKNQLVAISVITVISTAFSMWLSAKVVDRFVGRSK